MPKPQKRAKRAISVEPGLPGFRHRESTEINGLGRASRTPPHPYHLTRHETLCVGSHSEFFSRIFHYFSRTAHLLHWTTPGGRANLTSEPPGKDGG